MAAPMKGPTQNIHCRHTIKVKKKKKDTSGLCLDLRTVVLPEELNSKILTWSSQALSLPYITAAPKLRAGLMPVPVTGIVAR